MLIVMGTLREKRIETGMRQKNTSEQHTRILLLLAVVLIAAGIIWAVGRFRTYHVVIPTYDQYEYGYPKGCEGVSLYMAMKGKGYLEEISLEEFMDSMPRSDSNPDLGYVGDPTETKTSGANAGKRTTINPGPLAAWGSEYGKVSSLQGAEAAQLKAELRKGNPLVVYVTVNWAAPKWGTWDWGDAVTNNHAVCLVGYRRDTGEYLVNDCGKHNGEYWVEKEVFEECYNARKFAVVVE